MGVMACGALSAVGQLVKRSLFETDTTTVMKNISLGAFIGGATLSSVLLLECTNPELSEGAKNAGGFFLGYLASIQVQKVLNSETTLVEAFITSTNTVLNCVVGKNIIRVVEKIARNPA